MFAIALCVDRNYLVPSLVTLTSFAESVTPGLRSEIAVRIVTPDLRSSEVTTARDVCRRLGFGSFGAWRQPHLNGTPINHGTYITRTTYLRFALREGFIGRPFVLYLDAYGPALPGLADTYPQLKGRAYYNAGAVWMETTMLSSFRHGPLECLHTGAKFIHFNDQDALNLWVLREGHAADVPEPFNIFELDRLRQQSDWVDRVVGPRKPLTDARVVHFIGPDKPWLPACPGTEGVRWYLTSLLRTRSLIRRVGDLTLDMPTTDPSSSRASAHLVSRVGVIRAARRDHRQVGDVGYKRPSAVARRRSSRCREALRASGSPGLRAGGSRSIPRGQRPDSARSPVDRGRTARQRQGVPARVKRRGDQGQRGHCPWG
jgi:lipopolysaccharide biosynthesis glycosyltransferase